MKPIEKRNLIVISFLLSILFIPFSQYVENRVEYLGFPFPWINNYSKISLKTINGLLNILNITNMNYYLFRGESLILNILIIYSLIYLTLLIIRYLLKILK